MRVGGGGLMKTIREEKHGKSVLRLIETKDSYAGVIITAGAASAPVVGDDADEVWAEMVRNLGRADPSYFGFDGAQSRFLRLFPEGFTGLQFRSFERDYKEKASAQLNASVPLSAATAPTAAHCELIAKVYSKTNLLSQFEQARTREVLKSGDGPEFVRGAAAVAQGDVAAGLSAMERAFRPHGQPSWPAATYLPFLWRPDTQMFLKPQVTRDFADRVGHEFGRSYSPRFEARVYNSLLSLASATEQAIGSLQPADRIDVQSFIWVVGAYKDSDAAEQVEALS